MKKQEIKKLSKDEILKNIDKLKKEFIESIESQKNNLDFSKNVY